MKKAIGFALIAIAIACAVLGFNESQSLGSEVSEVFTGNPSDQTVTYLIIGLASAAAGLFLVLRK